MPRVNYHTEDGTRVKGVTTILNILSKPGLYGYYYYQGLDSYQQLSSKLVAFLNSGGTPDGALDMIKQFVPKGMNEHRDKAADIGTLAHLMVEEWLKEQADG